jgi:hypothetical protein
LPRKKEESMTVNLGNVRVDVHIEMARMSEPLSAVEKAYREARIDRVVEDARNSLQLDLVY